MQTAAVSSLPAPAPAAQRAPDAGQAARPDAKQKTGSDDSPFQTCLARGTGEAEKPKQDAETDTPEEDGAKTAKQDGDPCAAAVSGLIAQLFAAAPQDAGSGPETSPPAGSAAVSAPPADAGDAAGEALALPDAGKAGAAPETQAQADAAPAGMPAASYEDISAARQDGRQKSPAQLSPAASGGEGEAAAGGVAERIAEAMRSQGKEENGAQSFGKLLSGGKERVPAKRTRENPAAWGPVPAGETADNIQNAEKSRAVEKALDRFVHDFRGAETEKSELRIVLEPERLGALTISVSKTGNGVSAKIKSDDKEICALISGHLQKLVQAMESRGVAVENVDVVFGGAEQNLNFAQGGPGGGGENPSGHAARQGEKMQDAQAAAFFDLWNFPAGGAGADSTVEYRV